MSRTLAVLLCVGLMAPVQAGPADKKKTRFRMRLATGARYVGSNTVTYELKTKIMQGDEVTHTVESVQRTERFIDEVLRAGLNDMEIRRNYLRAYTKTRDAEKARPTVKQSSTQGRSVLIRETNRRRTVKMVGTGTIDLALRRGICMEIDWRDIFPEKAVGPGDEWDAEVRRLSRRFARSLKASDQEIHMRVRYEANVVRDGSRQAKFYVDWSLAGMRDRKLHASVKLAGDVYFDFALQRVVDVDLAGSFTVRGTDLSQRQPIIFKGKGTVALKTTVRRAAVQASAGDDGDDQDDR